MNQGQQSSVSEFLSKYIGEVDDFGFRGQVRIAPPNTPIDFTFRAEISRLNRDSTTGQHIGTTFGGNQIGLGGADRAGYRDPDIAAREAELFDAIKLSRTDLAGPPRDPDRPFRVLSRRELARELYNNPLDQNPYRGDVDRPGRTILDTHVASMTGVIDLDEIDIKMQAGFVDYKKSEGNFRSLPGVFFFYDLSPIKAMAGVDVSATLGNPNSRRAPPRCAAPLGSWRRNLTRARSFTPPGPRISTTSTSGQGQVGAHRRAPSPARAASAHRARRVPRAGEAALRTGSTPHT